MKTERMKKYFWLFLGALLTIILLSPALATDILQEYDKVIWINQLWQTGAAYERGKKVREFPVLTGDAETTTKPGVYVVHVKQEDYYSRKYQTPMPYAIFFNYTQRAAIHGGEVPPPRLKRRYATHGCIHVKEPVIQWLYDWTEPGRTVVVIGGWRTED
jgi:lipoprotein-anchoring transpeptidase ErfK/SrfK